MTWCLFRARIFTIYTPLSGWCISGAPKSQFYNYDNINAAVCCCRWHVNKKLTMEVCRLSSYAIAEWQLINQSFFFKEFHLVSMVCPLYIIDALCMYTVYFDISGYLSGDAMEDKRAALINRLLTINASALLALCATMLPLTNPPPPPPPPPPNTVQYSPNIFYASTPKVPSTNWLFFSEASYKSGYVINPWRIYSKWY